MKRGIVCIGFHSICMPDIIIENSTNCRCGLPMASSISARSTGSFPEDSVMLRTLQKDGNILVFTFATALNASGGFEKNIRRLTGMNIRKDLRRKVRMQYAEKHSQDPLAAGVDTIRIEQGGDAAAFLCG